MHNIPIWIGFVLILVFVIAFQMWRSNIRRKSFLAAAKNFGFVLSGDEDDADLPVMSDFPLFEKNGDFDLAARGNWNGLDACVFDYSFSEGKSSVEQTAASFIKPDANLNLPLLQIHRRRFGDGVGALFTSEAVKIADAPEFHERFTVRSPSPEFAAEFFAPDVRAHFESLGEFSCNIEMSCDAVMVYVPRKKVDAEKLQEFVMRGAEIAEGIFALAAARRSIQC